MRETRQLALAFAAVLGTIGGAGCGDTAEPSGADGTLVVHITTTGEDPDADGYRITLDAGDAGGIGRNASVTFPDLASGDHAVGVGGLAGNCEVSGDNPRTVIVPAGDTVEVLFAVSCAFLPATVIVRTSTSGPGPDLDGYLVSADGARGKPVGIQDSVTFAALGSGAHEFRLLDLASNCTVAGDNPVALTIAAGATDSLTFSISCTGVSPAHLLFTGHVGDVSHVFERASDGSITDLTPEDDGAEGRWSPDGSRIVFTSVRSGTLGIYVMDADGQNVVQLTNNGETIPSWSPDGTKILFWPYATAGFGEITVMNADGSDVQVLGQGSNPAWSPHGARIAFERSEQGACALHLCVLNIYTMAVDGTDVKKLTRSTLPWGMPSRPAWSPNGTTIAYLRWANALGSTLQVMTSTGAPIRELGTALSAPVWSPSGGAIAVSQSSPTGRRIVAIPVNGGAAAELVNRPDAVPTSWR